MTYLFNAKKRDKDKLQAFGMKYYRRRILNVGSQQKKTNEDIMTKTNENGTRNHGENLSLFGHILQMLDEWLIRTVTFSFIDGNGRKGRTCRKWQGDATEWHKKIGTQL